MKTAEKLKSRQATQAIQDEKFVEQQRIKRANGNGLWLELREIIEEKCRSLNRNVGHRVVTFEETTSGEVTVRTIVDDATRTLHAEFYKEGLQMHWDCGDRHGHYHLAATGKGGVTFVRAQEDAPIAPQEIAEILLDILLSTEGR